jgi:hypothetical protein
MTHMRGVVAGQAIVAFARSISDQGTYAIKFFMSPKDFRSEMAIYQDSPLGKLLPRLEGMYDSEAGLQDRQGHQLPPCIVMERGESLDEWSRRRKPDMWAAMPVRPRMHGCVLARCAALRLLDPVHTTPHLQKLPLASCRC